MLSINKKFINDESNLQNKAVFSQNFLFRSRF